MKFFSKPSKVELAKEIDRLNGLLSDARQETLQETRVIEDDLNTYYRGMLENLGKKMQLRIDEAQSTVAEWRRLEVLKIAGAPSGTEYGKIVRWLETGSWDDPPLMMDTRPEGTGERGYQHGYFKGWNAALSKLGGILPNDVLSTRVPGFDERTNVLNVIQRIEKKVDDDATGT